MKDMHRSPIPGNPLARLVLFMILLACAGSSVAGAHYFALDLPAEKTIQTPVNADGDDRDALQKDLLRLMMEQQKNLDRSKEQIIWHI